jgi:hypothetical protein
MARKNDGASAKTLVNLIRKQRKKIEVGVTATPLAGHECSSHQDASLLLLARGALDQRRKLRLMGLRIATAKKAVSITTPVSHQKQPKRNERDRIQAKRQQNRRT